MKVEIISLTDAGQERRDYSNAIEIKINDLRVFSVYDGEPEDNNLNRNFRDCFTIEKLIVLAYNAGRNDEDLEIKHLRVDEI